MIAVTDGAKALLDRLLHDALVSAPARTKQDHRCLRVVSRDNVFGVKVDTPSEGDRVVDYNGKPLLLISPDLDAALDGGTIRARQTPDGEKLMLSRAKAA